MVEVDAGASKKRRSRAKKVAEEPDCSVMDDEESNSRTPSDVACLDGIVVGKVFQVNSVLHLQ